MKVPIKRHGKVASSFDFKGFSSIQDAIDQRGEEWVLKILNGYKLNMDRTREYKRLYQKQDRGALPR